MEAQDLFENVGTYGQVPTYPNSAVYFSILEIASRMSSTRSRQPLGGNNRLAKDSIAELRLEGCRRHEIDAMPDKLGKLSLQADELEKADRAVEFDEEVNVAIVAPLVPRERAEERQPGHTKDVQH